MMAVWTVCMSPDASSTTQRTGVRRGDRHETPPHARMECGVQPFIAIRVAAAPTQPLRRDGLRHVQHDRQVRRPAEQPDQFGNELAVGALAIA